MKKLMFVAAVAAAMTGVCDVSSANICGYQNKALNAAYLGADGNFTAIINTLPAIGSDLAGIPLKNIMVVAPEGGLWSEGSAYITTYDKGGHIKGEYCYLDENLYPGFLAEKEGWYLFSTIYTGAPVSADEETIAFDEGMMVQSDCGATITFAGEVLQQKTSIAFDATGGAFTCSGNCSPVTVKLEDIEVITPEGGLWSEGSVYVTTYDAGGHIKGEYCYLDENLAPGFLAEGEGWYLFNTIYTGTPVSAGKEEIEAGEMFMIQTDCGATINIPSPVPAAE